MSGVAGNNRAEGDYHRGGLIRNYKKETKTKKRKKRNFGADYENVAVT